MRGAALHAAAAALLLAPGVAGAAPQASFTLRFDLLSPAGISCTADAPGAQVRSGRDLKGAPLMTVTGDLAGARVTCIGPDGVRWQTGLPLPAADPLAAAVEGIAVYRRGAARLPLLVGTGRDHYRAIDVHRFTRLP